jgi:hypothetical protein
MHRPGISQWLAAVALAWVLLTGHGGVVAAQDPGRAALIVRLDEERVETRCVAFSEPQITGYELLRRSGLEMEANVQGMGALVCEIQGTGCPLGDCLCQCKGGEACTYWSYWNQTEGEWHYATVGASAYQVEDRAVEGWSWGPGSVAEAIEPPSLSFEEVCSGAVAAGDAPAPDPAASAAPTQLIAAGAAAVLLFGIGFLAVRRRGSTQ